MRICSLEIISNLCFLHDFKVAQQHKMASNLLPEVQAVTFTNCIALVLGRGAAPTVRVGMCSWANKGNYTLWQETQKMNAKEDGKKMES